MNLERFPIIQNHKGWFNYNLWNYKCKLTQDFHNKDNILLFCSLNLRKIHIKRNILLFFAFKYCLVFVLLKYNDMKLHDLFLYFEYSNQVILGLK